MASFKIANTSLVHLLHDHIYTHPANNSLVCLNAGEKFHLVEKVSDNWWSVVRTEQDHQLLYVPVCYVEEIEEIPRGKHPDVSVGFSGKREPPPKPPVKPKNLPGKRDLPPEANKSFPALTNEARIELFNILMSQNDGKSKSREVKNETGNRSSDESELEKEGGADGDVAVAERLASDRDVFDENSGSTARHGYKGSMQSLDLEFLDDCEVVEASLNDKSPDDATAQYYVNAELLHVQSHQSGLPPWPPDGAVPLKTYEGGYESYCDSASGRTFYYNRLTEERSWILPRKVSQSTKENIAAEDGSKNGLSAVSSLWKEELNASGETIFVNQINGEKWIRLFDHESREYFFNDETQESRWDLPESDSTDEHKFGEDSDQDVYEFSDKAGTLYKAKLSDNGKKINDDSYKYTRGSLEHASNRRKREDKIRSRNMDSKNRKHNLLIQQLLLCVSLRLCSNQFLEKLVAFICCAVWIDALLSQRTKGNEYCKIKLQEEGYGEVKVNMSKPEGFLDLRSTTIQMGNNTRSSRKNLIQLTNPNGTEYLLHHEEMDVIEEWYEALSKNISLLTRLMSTLTTEKGGSSQSLNSEVDRSPNTTNTLDSASPAVQKKNKEKHKQPKKELATVQQETVQSTAEKVRLKEKLRFWLNRRPTRDSLRAKGIYKDGIFGSHLLTICEAENATIPKFVQDCIDAVEARGLTTDGIYRMNGNMADIQKLRFLVNQNDEYNLMDPDLDIHVVTGALKLFFRELMEPLLPFRFCNKFLDSLRITDHTAKSKALRELVLLIPTANHDTLKELFRHLVLVIQHSRENRMQAQNIAIVFGPTLIWPEETDMSELAVSVVQRGQLIEHMLTDYTFIFS